MGNPQEAELLYRKAIEHNPNFVDAHCNLGDILQCLCNFKEAELSIRKAIEIEATHIKAYVNLEYTLCALKEYKKANKVYENNLKLDPNNKLLKSGLSSLLSTKCEWNKLHKNFIG